MIAQFQIAQAMADIDAEAEEHQDQEKFWHKRGIDPEAIHDCAMQHGLRAVLIARGEKPPKKTDFVRVSGEEQIQQMLHAGSWLAGMATMHRLKETSPKETS